MRDWSQVFTITDALVISAKGHVHGHTHTHPDTPTPTPTVISERGQRERGREREREERKERERKREHARGSKKAIKMQGRKLVRDIDSYSSQTRV